MKAQGGRDIQLFDENSPNAAKLLRELHDDILAPAFRAEEYIRPTTIDPGAGPALIACRDDGLVVGGALGGLYPASASLLLEYLAVRPGFRGTGVGSVILAAVVERWLDGTAPAFVELDDPRHTAPDPGHGDPAARLRFYDTVGVRLLAIPYFQPRLRAELPRAYHMLLGVLPPKGAHMPADMPADRVRAFLREYFEACEGRGALDDGEVQWLLGSSGGSKIALVGIEEVGLLPDTLPPQRAEAEE
jgi:GNAT superfamily N-acetyltransferase